MSLQHEKDALVFYIRQAWEAAGLKFNGDNVAEVESIVDGIYDEAVRQANININQLASSHNLV